MLFYLRLACVLVLIKTAGYLEGRATSLVLKILKKKSDSVPQPHPSTREPALQLPDSLSDTAMKAREKAWESYMGQEKEKKKQ